MKEETIKQLQKISKPRTFSKDEYICYEGEPGNEMFIILRGYVGVYITNAMGTLSKVAQMKEGDFFGEMAIFDNLPRSASCIALEDTICVAIGKQNLVEFICQCPDMAEKILENLSIRIRKLNNDLYKSNHNQAVEQREEFAIPAEYSFSHVVKEPYQNEKYFAYDKQICPICGEEIVTVNMKRHLMEVKNVDMDGRVNYLMCDPLWHEILSCPHCHYSNYRIAFFDIDSSEVQSIRTIVKDEQAPVVEKKISKGTPFDKLVLRYLQAIHINECIRGKDCAHIGVLWLYLYWLAKDSGDERFTEYCADKAIERFKVAVDANKTQNAMNHYALALSLGNLLLFKNMDDQAMEYAEIALGSADETVRSCAKEFVETISNRN